MKTFDLRALSRVPGPNPGDPDDYGILLYRSDDKPLVDERTGQQQSRIALDFLLTRTGDPKFTAGLDPDEAIELKLKARERLRREYQKADGLIVLEDDHAKRLVDAIRKPVNGYNEELSHNFGPFIQIAKSVKDGDLRKAATDAEATATDVEPPAA